MKKLFTLITAAAAALAMTATTYTGQLTVTVNGQSSSQDGVNIVIEPNGSNYNLTLQNFILSTEGQTMPVGNIALTDIPAIANANLRAMYVDKSITISNGDSSSPVWYGPYLGQVPLKMLARFADDYLMVDINIHMTVGSEEQDIIVKFDNTDGGKNGFQIPNSDFETWTASSGEPQSWHGFASASGSLKSTPQQYASLASDTDKRPGSTGSKSAKIGSGYYPGFLGAFATPVNGTMTNGQLNAGSMTASDSDNNSHMDTSTSDTGVDKDGKPFFTALVGKPDAIKTWIKFTQSSAVSAHPYATISTILYDTTIDSYYQDPENTSDKNHTYVKSISTYNNVAAKAKNTKIPTGAWKEYTVAFDYDTYAKVNTTALPKAILVTISTNADAGSGSKNGDYVWVDDMELVYNGNVTDIKFQGSTLSGFNADVTDYTINYEGEQTFTADDFDAIIDGVGAVIVKNVAATATGYQAIIAGVAGNLETKTYTINLIRKPIVKGLKVNDNEVANFDPAVTEYEVTLDAGTELTEDDFAITLDVENYTSEVIILDNDYGFTAMINATANGIESETYTINVTCVTPLATVLASEDDVFAIKEDLKVVAVKDDNVAYATDGANWIRLDSDTDTFTEGAVIGTVKGMYEGDALAPAFLVESYKDGSSSVVATIEQVDLRFGFAMPQASQVIEVKGYYEAGGTLRGWAGGHGQSLSLDGGADNDSKFTVNDLYKVLVGIELKGDWKDGDGPNAALRRARGTYDYDFQNLNGVVLEVTRMDTTGIDNIESADENSEVRYIDLMGRTHTTPVAGVNIIVRNGKATKVIY